MSFNIHELSRKLGRRAYSRFIIPGAAIFWKTVGQKSFSDQNSPLSDISRGGLSFLTNDPPSVESEVALSILLPKTKEKVELFGKVKYSTLRGPRLTYTHRVGVELWPFDNSDNCNSLQTLQQIEALEKEYGERKKR
jgi:hypothetical protein